MQTKTITVPTDRRDQMVEITSQVQDFVRTTNTTQGYVVVYIPHTTAGVTINENADPDVVHDMLLQLDEMVPWRQPVYRHVEGNSASHVKATMTGSSATILIQDGRLILGTWQGIYFCEFDGPRSRKAVISVFGA